MEDKICIPLSLPREAFVMRSNCNMIGQYLNNNRKIFGEHIIFIRGGVRSRKQ